MRITPIDTSRRAYAESELLKKAIVPHSLGRLGDLAIRLALIRGGRLEKPIHLLFAGDHGITEEGVTHSPKIITAQQCRSFARGGGACSLFCRLSGIEMRVIDVGVDDSFEADSGVIDCKVGRGTHNFLAQPAMSPHECTQAMEIGAREVSRAVDAGFDTIIFGEMGVGNTTSASAICAALLAVDPMVVTGKGSGLSDSELLSKCEVIRRGLRLHADRSPLAVLASFGGFEIAAITGGILEAARRGMPIIIDGAVVSSAALVALHIDRAVQGYLVFGHRSAMTGHDRVLTALGCTEPILDLGMQLGEGTGALAAWPLVRLASHILDDLESFEEAGVSDSTRLLMEKGLV